MNGLEGDGVASGGDVGAGGGVEHGVVFEGADAVEAPLGGDHALNQDGFNGCLGGNSARSTSDNWLKRSLDSLGSRRQPGLKPWRRLLREVVLPASDLGPWDMAPLARAVAF